MGSLAGRGEGEEEERREFVPLPPILLRKGLFSRVRVTASFHMRKDTMKRVRFPILCDTYLLVIFALLYIVVGV